MKHFYTIILNAGLVLIMCGCTNWFAGSDEGFETTIVKPNTQSSTLPRPSNFENGVAIATQGSVQVFDLSDMNTNKTPDVNQFGNYETSGNGNIIVSTNQDEQVTLNAPSMLQNTGRPAAQSQRVQLYGLGERVTAPALQSDYTRVQPVKQSSNAFAQRAQTPNFRSPEFAMARDQNGEVVVIYFNHDSVFLNGNDRSKIANAANKFGRNGDILVEGHASTVSSLPNGNTKHIVNLKISMDRAFGVAKALIESGVPASRIKVKAYGDAQPPIRFTQAPNRNAAARRVEISGTR